MSAASEVKSTVYIVDDDQAIRHAIRERDVPRPSVRFTSLAGTQDVIAQCRRTTADVLKRELKTDLDVRSLEKLDRAPN